MAAGVALALGCFRKHRFGLLHHRAKDLGLGTLGSGAALRRAVETAVIDDGISHFRNGDRHQGKCGSCDDYGSKHFRTRRFLVRFEGESRILPMVHCNN